MESSRKGREAIRSGPATLGGNREEEGSTEAQRSFLGSEQLDHIRGAPVLGSYTGEMSPIDWLEDHWDSQEDCGKPELHLQGAFMLWLSFEAQHRM